MEDQGGKSYFLSPNNLSNTGRSCCQKNWFPLAERCKPSLKNDCQLSFATMAAHKSRYSIFSILAMCTTRRAYSFVLSFCLSPDQPTELSLAPRQMVTKTGEVQFGGNK
eukprot:TRINITY_DN3922_c0_g1_i7.p2 TRINITY_DN3922_c0_g1~~TRINITY_DN3922_c0_g1_i7.p2  ORF type:complete len:109 (-),score=7.10 TRINITY_DN3922_c0_g1_i7:275-601(-)